MVESCDGRGNRSDLQGFRFSDTKTGSAQGAPQEAHVIASCSPEVAPQSIQVSEKIRLDASESDWRVQGRRVDGVCAQTFWWPTHGRSIPVRSMGKKGLFSRPMVGAREPDSLREEADLVRHQWKP